MFRWREDGNRNTIEKTRNKVWKFAEDGTDWHIKLSKEEWKCPGRNGKEKSTFGEKIRNIF